MPLQSRFKQSLHRAFFRFGLDVRKIYPMRIPDLPDRDFYSPVFSPWLGYGNFERYLSAARQHTIVPRESLYILYALASNALRLPGEFWECGVYKGGTARLLADLLAESTRPDGQSATLRLFDTFAGMPEADGKLDVFEAGEYSDTSVDAVRAVVGHPDLAVFHPGFIPDTFDGLNDSRIAFAHVDVVLYHAIRDCCEFIYPRLVPGGILLFDDYGIAACPGARKAVDEYFADKPEIPVVLPTGQAMVIRSPAVSFS